jgi:hypothetical protein
VAFYELEEDMKILISGEAKTGTTALYCAIRDKMSIVSHFEPEIKYIKDVLADENSITKSLVGTAEANDLYSAGHFSEFDKRVFLVRDPRDTIISLLLYIGSFHRVFIEPDKIRSAVKLLQQKESDNSISFLKIWTHIFRDRQKLSFFLSRNLMIEATSKYDHYLLKYESFVDGDVQGLCDYLEIDSLNSNVDVGEFSRVTRTKSYGDWKNWFTEEDIEFFRPLFEPYLNHFNYKDDWQVNEKPFIDSKFCSQYFIDRVDERRNNSEMPDWREL